jgi:D-beta-D-heptose 7-phosphate kinase/D-beta-D-heptose 1-phosphate adenosyltransferase
VLIFEEDTPHCLLRRLRPEVLVKGGTYSVEEVVGKEIVEAYGGRVCVVAKVEGVSTTDILAAVRKH